MNTLKTYLSTQLQPFDKTTLWFSSIVKKEVAMTLGRTALVALAVWLVARYRESLPYTYLDAAIAEGISSHLWNIVGSAGLVLTGFVLMFPQVRFIARRAYGALICAYTSGVLSLGLLLGRLITALTLETANIATWKIWLTATSGIVLACLVGVIHFSLWYLGRLVSSEGTSERFLHCVGHVDLRLRAIIAFFFIVPPIAWFFMEK